MHQLVERTESDTPREERGGKRRDASARDSIVWRERRGRGGFVAPFRLYIFYASEELREELRLILEAAAGDSSLHAPPDRRIETGGLGARLDYAPVRMVKL